MANQFVDWLQKKVVHPINEVEAGAGAGLARAVVGGAQAASGLADLAGGNKGPSQFDKNLNTAAQTLDTTAKVNHVNPVLYHGSQIAANLIPTDLGEDAAGAAVKAIPKVADLAPKIEDATKGLEESGHLGSIAAKTIRGASSVKNLGLNAGYQAYNAGQQVSQGKHVNPVSQAENLGIYQVGAPLAGAGSKEALDTVAPVIAKTAKGVISKFGEPALAGAEKATGLSRNSLVNDNEAGTLSDEIDRLRGRNVGNATQTAQQAHAIGNNIGLDVTSGAPEDRASRIENYLTQRRNFVNAHNQIAQGGYVKLPGDASDELVQKVFHNQGNDNSLYHGTKYNSAVDILNSGAIKTSKPNAARELIPDSPDGQVSLSRQHNSGFYNSKIADVKFVVDKDKLGKTTQYVDGDLKPSDFENPGIFESEEQTKKDIPLSAVKRIEGGPLLEPDEEKELATVAAQHNIPFVAYDDIDAMRKILPTSDLSGSGGQSHVPGLDSLIEERQAVKNAKDYIDNIVSGKGLSDEEKALPVRTYHGNTTASDEKLAKILNLRRSNGSLPKDFEDYLDSLGTVPDLDGEGDLPFSGQLHTYHGELLKEHPELELEKIDAILRKHGINPETGKTFDEGAATPESVGQSHVPAASSEQPSLPESSLNHPTETLPTPQTASEPPAQPPEQTGQFLSTSQHEPIASAVPTAEQAPSIEPKTKTENNPQISSNGPEDASLNKSITPEDFNRKLTDNPSTITKEDYAKAFGLTPLQASQDFEDMSVRELDQKHMSKEQLAKLGPQSEGLSVAQKRELIRTDPNQATKNEVELNPLTHDSYSLKDRARSAIAQAEGINQEAEYRLQRAVKLGQGLSAHDQQLLYKYDAGDSIMTLAPYADNPKQFIKAGNAYADATDYDLASRRAGYEPTLRQNNYVPHNYAVSQEWMDEHQIPEDQRIQIGDEVKGFRDTSAKYPSYAEAAKQTGGKLKPLYNSPVEDLKDYTDRGGISRRNHLLGAAFGKATPGDVGLLREVKVGDKNLTQAAGNLPFSASDDLQQHLNGYRKPDTIFSKGIDKVTKGVNNFTKRVLFLGTPYHYMNEQASFIGKNLLNPTNLATGEKRFVQTIATKGGFQRLLDVAENTTLPNGKNLLESIRKMGIALPDDSALSRASSAFSLTEAEAALRKGLDPDSKEAVDIGQQINHLMGHRNQAIEGQHPFLRQTESFGTLAPHWTATQLGLVKDALLPSKHSVAHPIETLTHPIENAKAYLTDSSRNYARGAIAGKRAALTIAGIGGSAALARKVPTLSQTLNEAGLTLKNPIPNIELNTKNKSNSEAQEMVTPTDPLGLAVGLATNPGHFVGSRLSPGASFLDKLATNQNWNGEPLATGVHDSDYYASLVKNAAINSLTPIGVQNFTNFTHAANNPSILQGVAEDFGGRLKTNPNDPNYVATQKYYKVINDVEDSLNTPADQGSLSTVTNYLTSYKNAAGQTEEKAPAETMARWQSLVGDPKALSAIQKVQTSGSNPDPAWQLPSSGTGGKYIGANGKTQTTSKLQVYAMYEAMPNGDANRTQLEQLNPWITNVFSAEQDWFNKGISKGTAVPYTGPLPGGLTTKDLQYPNLTNAQNRMMSQVTQLSSIPAANRTTLQQKQLSNLENNSQLNNAYSALDTYTNNMRVAKGYSPLKYAPSEPPAVTEGIAAYDALPEGTGARSQWITAHPALYTQMSNYYAASDQATIDKDASLADLQGESPTSSLLGAEYDAGKYDVAKTTNPNGTSTYSINPALAYTQSSGSSSGSTDITPAYVAVHDAVSGKKPSIQKLKTTLPYGQKKVASVYKKPKVTKPTVHTSTISRGTPHSIGKKLAVAGLA